jgi:hypothetical protein
MELDMRHVKTTMIVAAALVLTVLLGVVGCGHDDHRDHYRSGSDRYPSGQRDSVIIERR